MIIKANIYSEIEIRLLRIIGAKVMERVQGELEFFEENSQEDEDL